MQCSTNGSLSGGSASFLSAGIWEEVAVLGLRAGWHLELTGRQLDAFPLGWRREQRARVRLGVAAATPGCGQPERDNPRKR